MIFGQCGSIDGSEILRICFECREDFMKVGKRNDQDSLASEIVGFLLLALGLFLFACLLTFDRYDHLIICELQSGTVRNFAGVAGALVAISLLWPLGLVAHVFPVVCVILGLRELKKGAMDLKSLEVLVFVTMLLSVSTLFSVLNSLSPAATVAIEFSGGFVGFFLSELITRWILPFNAALLLSAMSLIYVALFLRFSVEVSFKGFGSWLSSLWQYAQPLHPVDNENHKTTVFESIYAPVETSSTSALASCNGQQDFPVQKSSDMKEQDSSFLPPFRLPPLSLLDPGQPLSSRNASDDQDSYVGLIEQRLAEFKVAGKIVGINPGPVVTMYEFEPDPGVKLSKIAGLSDDLAMALSALSVRIVAPIPGRGLVGIELPNAVRETIMLKDVLGSEEFQANTWRMPLALGKDTAGKIVAVDLAKMPHLLIAGSTGSGKSVSINGLLLSLLFASSPREVRFILIDTKMLELSAYNGIPALLLPIVTDPYGAIKVLDWAVCEMRRRNQLLVDMSVRNIDGYNRKIAESVIPSNMPDSVSTEGKVHGHVHLPYIVICIDEFASLLMTGGKKVEDAIVHLTQMARASGIHLILSTQRPSVDIVTGLIKANMPARLSFKVITRVDSRTILDQIGAEALLGNGDALFLSPEGGGIKRIHGAFISDEEVERVVDFLKSQGSPDYDLSIINAVFSEDSGEGETAQDELWDEALRIVAGTRQASISHLQRHLRIGFNRAARFLEKMEQEGLVSSLGSSGRKREIFIERFTSD